MLGKPRSLWLPLLSLLLGVGLTFSLAAKTPKAPKPLAWRISEGKGIGPIQLEAIPTWDHLQKLGRPKTLGFHHKTGVRLDRLRADWSIDLIEVFAPFAGKTTRGIGIDSPMAEVRKVHGDPFAYEEGDTLLWLYKKQGIGFKFKKEKVTHIGLFSWEPLRFPESGAAPKTETIKILPGTGIRGLVFGINTTGDITHQFGAPPIVQQADKGRFGTIYLYPELGLSVLADSKTQAITQLFFTAPFKGQTENGIGIGAKIDEIRRAFGNQPLDYIHLRYPDRGLAFLLDDDRTMAISVINNLAAK